MMMPIDRIDFMDYLRNNLDETELADIESEAKRKISNLQILSFINNPNGDGRIVALFDNHIVFVDRRYTGGPILAGEVWLCSLEFNSSVYIATPLKRITSTILLELDAPIRNGIIEQLWKEKKDQYEAHFEELYRQNLTQELTTKFNGELKDALSKKDDEISTLKDTISGLKQELMELRSDKNIDHIDLTSDEIALYSDEPEQNVATSPVEFAHTPKCNNYDPLHSVNQPYKYNDVYRTNYNSITSTAFTERRYSVHISPNLSVILVRPDNNGDVPCVNNSLCLYGLNALIPFNGREKMEAEYSSKYNGMIISTRFKP